MRGIDFVNQAECNDADPAIFDTTHLGLALVALAYCQRCRVSLECELLVAPPPPAPMSWYDGVAGRKVWSNGVVIAELSDSVQPQLILVRERELFDPDIPELQGSNMQGD